MKKHLKKLLPACLVLALSLALAACGGSAADTPEDALTRAQTAYESVKSMHYTIDMDMAFSAEGESIEMKTAAEADCIVEPMTMGMDMNMDMMGFLNMDIKMYLVQDGDSYTMYTGMDDGDGNISWSKETLDDLGDIAQYNGKESMKIYLENGSSFTEAGTEEVAGVTATRYDGVITQDSLNAVMEASGVLEQYEALGLEGMEDLLSDMGDLPVSIWIDPDTDLPVKYEMDMTAMMQSMISKMLAEEGEGEDTDFTVDKCSIVMICTDIDAIEIPEEALNAASADEAMTDLFADEESELLEEAAEDAA